LTAGLCFLVAIIAALPTLPARAQFELRSLLRRMQSANVALRFPGGTGIYLSTPDAALLDLTGDFEMRMRLSLPSWTPAGEQALISKWVGSGNASYYWLLNAGGGVRTAVCADGTNGQFSTAEAHVYDAQGKLLASGRGTYFTAPPKT